MFFDDVFLLFPLAFISCCKKQMKPPPTISSNCAKPNLHMHSGLGYSRTQILIGLYNSVLILNMKNDMQHTDIWASRFIYHSFQNSTNRKWKLFAFPPHTFCLLFMHLLYIYMLINIQYQALFFLAQVLFSVEWFTRTYLWQN